MASKEVPEEAIPATVKWAANDLFERTGVAAVVERVGIGHLRLVHSNDRIRLEMDVRMRISCNRWGWGATRLFKDGEQISADEGIDHYVMIFEDPDFDMLDYTPPGAKKAEIPEHTRLEGDAELPPSIARYYRISSKDLERNADVERFVGKRNDGSGYLLGFHAPGKGSIYFCFSQQPDGWRKWSEDNWGVDKDTPVIIVSRNGYDLSESFGGNSAEVGKALAQLFGLNAMSQAIPTSTGYGDTRQAAAVNSVAVRKSTVVRV